MSNPSGYEPTEFNVIVLPDKVEEKTKGGIYIPEQSKDRDQHASTSGTLIAVSPLAWTYEVWPAGARKPQPGDKVLWARYAGSRIDPDKPEGFWVIKDRDILAVKAQ